MVDTHQGGIRGGPERPELELFQSQWQLYQKMVDNDYFHQREAYHTLHGFLVSKFNRPFRFLDLACGDASGIIGALEGTRIEHYSGVDLSVPALQLAEANLAALQCPVSLERADFTEAVKDPSRKRDVVWFGLSLHHLTTKGKRELMGDARKLLAPGGAFVIYEPTLREGEDRPAFLERFETLARGTWTACTADEVAAAMEHMRSSDLPETRADWLALGEEAGFSSAEEIFRAPTDLIRMFAFEA